MKKIIVTLLAAAMLLSCTLAFSACSLFNPQPETDLEEAMENLEDADYEVDYEEEVDEVGISEQLSAFNEDGDRITIIVFEDKKLAELEYDKYKLTEKMEDEMEKAAEKDAKKHGEDYNQSLVVEKYEEKSDKLAYEYAKHMLDKYDDELSDEEIENYEDIVDRYANGEPEIIFGKSGKVFWYGTKQAIEDSKG